jgi:signal transduction histidine kinase
MKLLARTLKSYLIYSFTLLLVTVPLYYFLVKRVLIHSVDRSLRAQLRAIRSNLTGSISTADLQVWSRLDKDIRLEQAAGHFQDSIRTAYIKTRAGDNDDDPYRQLVAAIKVNGEYYTLTISTSLVENEDLLGTVVLVEALLLTGLMAGMLWINSSISRKLWAPFYETLSTIREYEFNRHAAIRLPETDTSEFTDLNRSLENLLKKNYNSYLEQKEFTENASHEMQTPLAIFQSQLEVLMQTSPLTEEQAGLIHSLEMNNKRLVRLNRSLLLLTKIENEEYQPTGPVNITELVIKFLLSYRYHIREKGLTLTETCESDITFRANKTLIEILVSNVISNAVKHNIPGGALLIQTAGAILTVRNTGIPQSLEPERIFQRFYRKSGETEGTGLGLAIVQRICKIGGFSIRYQYTGNLHEFKIDFSGARKMN